MGRKYLSKKLEKLKGELIHKQDSTIYKDFVALKARLNEDDKQALERMNTQIKRAESMLVLKYAQMRIKMAKYSYEKALEISKLELEDYVKKFKIKL